MHYVAELPMIIDGMPNPFIGAAIDKLNKYKIPHVVLGIELEGRDYIRIQQVDVEFVKKPRAPAKVKRSTGITSRPLDDGRHLHTDKDGKTMICSFAWDEARYWKVVRETSSRIDRRMKLGNYGLDYSGKVSGKLPLKGELFSSLGAAHGAE